MLNLDRCASCCNTVDKLSSRVRVLNEIKSLNLHVFNMITGTNESRTLKKCILCKCECTFDLENVTWIKIGIKKKNTFVSRNAGDKKNLHPGSRKFFLINLIELLK